MRETALSIRKLGPEDIELVHSAADLFDDPPIKEQTKAFLESDRDHIWIAYLGQEPVGMLTATTLLHPDKSPHIFVNELGIDDDYRRRGIATRLMAEAVSFARSCGLTPLWLAAEGDDDQANAFYRSLSEPTERVSVVYEWEE
ncbi:Ribosomal protein S18 acetylase RimI [Parasphingorhabdus marina DSM 22363]|uniref:Ribosomal protein S18 acetylase RimI n=1 Tax=Parasphingorhabdus marina DSM 22363 TaxID=1123272 RepID=A0A1N6GZ97_9SPHN|nr:GNAT family N-acetyltransferase [Parasphingorhabdus marina]SIO12695.1 Ribosomal protein S18 acetylase RimI [Parasphingorhabdus marina DSM 22363]